MRPVRAAGLCLSSTTTSACWRNRARPASAIGSATRTRSTGSGDEAGLGRLHRTLRGGQCGTPRHGVPIRFEAALQHVDRRHDVVLVHSAALADAEDLAGQLSLALADHEAQLAPGLEDRLGLFAAERLWEIECGDGRRRLLRV